MSPPPIDFAIIDGIKTGRPKNQNKWPKAFKGKPFPLAMLEFSEPTDRFVLWFISNYKYAFNIFHTSDYSHWIRPPQDVTKWKFYKYQILVKSLMDRHLIKHGDKKRLTLKITTKGQIYRIYTHPSFNFWAIVLGVLLAALGIFKDDIFKKGVSPNKTPQQTIQTIPQTADSALRKSVQIQPLSLKDSVSSKIDTSKTKIKDSL